MPHIVRRLLALGAVVSLAGVSACAQSQRDQGSGGGGGDTFVFGATSDPVMLDPAFGSDGETFRPARQIFEGLVGTKPGTTELAPRLATEWKSSADGKTHDFTLKQGVKFHDGTDFNAEAVCKNFDRWANWKGLNQRENVSYYYGKLFQGFKNPEGGSARGIYDSCETTSANQVSIHLNKPFASFVNALVLPSFAMQSPTAMEKYNADDTQGTAKDPRFSEYATAHPTGTGPFKFVSWDRGQQVNLERNENYHGDKAKVAKVTIRTITDLKARTQELQAGNIDGYDQVAPADLQVLKDRGMQIQTRPPFSIFYLGFNQANPALKDLRVRQALNHAIDKDALVKQSLPQGTATANEFMPDGVTGYNPDVTKYAYDPEKAKQLLKEAGQEHLRLKFAYPVGVSRAYMPTPEDSFVTLKGQLEKVGITIEPVTSRWTDYSNLVRGPESADKKDLFFLGWTGDYNDADNFLGVFFGRKDLAWGFDNPELFKALQDARQLPTKPEQEQAYKKMNETIAQFAPGVPLAHPTPALALGKGVQGFTSSPIGDEQWNRVSVSR